MKIIKDVTFEEWTEYRWEFNWTDGRGGGFAFDCDADGNPTNESECSRENFRKCRSGEFEVEDLGIKRYSYRQKSSAIGRCDCGEEVDLYGFTNTCYGCGSDYNSAGQLLAPREQWGEETGETLDEILRIP